MQGVGVFVCVKTCWRNIWMLPNRLAHFYFVICDNSGVLSCSVSSDVLWHNYCRGKLTNLANLANTTQSGCVGVAFLGLDHPVSRPNSGLSGWPRNCQQLSASHYRSIAFLQWLPLWKKMPCFHIILCNKARINIIGFCNRVINISHQYHGTIRIIYLISSDYEYWKKGRNLVKVSLQKAFCIMSSFGASIYTGDNKIWYFSFSYLVSFPTT